jgi:N-methylhydantoinase B
LNPLDLDSVISAYGRATRHKDASGALTVRLQGGQGASHGQADADPVATEVLRHALNSAADQMRIALCRTAFSAVIYDMLDFAVGLFDSEVRMLAQAPCLPMFMGNLSFLVDSAVANAGGVDALEPGDILIYNIPYGVGGHAQDVGWVMPVFLPDGDLVGYSAVRAHLMDLGGNAPYNTDTTDVFQEGTSFPGIKIYRRGERNEDVWRILLANTRFPRSAAGDSHASIVAARAGAAALQRVIQRHGRERFGETVDRLYDHGEAIIRSYFEKLPDGRYIGEGALDSDGISDEKVPFTVALEISGSDIVVDFSDAPDERPGPMNSLFPTTVSATRVAIAMLAGASEAPNEGFYRPITIVSRPGSMFHPLPPTASFLTDWPAGQAIEVIYHAISKAVPAAVPACSGGDPNVSILWGGTNNGDVDPWAEAITIGVGQGGDVRRDGAFGLHHVSCSSMRLVPAEVWEANNPLIVEKRELYRDSCGPGQHQGGLGHEVWIRMLTDGYITAVSERARTAPWGLAGGLPGLPNGRRVVTGDDDERSLEKVTGKPLAEGALVKLYGGGGGGYGPPAMRDADQVHHDVREGYVTAEFARRYYPHAFVESER